ncbi:metalloregulator ArsR/SmtB family transcription factor [Verrucomicrobiales bacterium BCK34]|nr:metalloregulator ArsR/SmtB family transcription factor [Verrucomicrobiales bacterium BCK34]
MEEEFISVYKCLCDLTRLRILNLLKQAPLCVCHVQDVLGEPQPKVSKQLSYLKRHGMIESVRNANWTIYRLPNDPGPLLDGNLKCLQDFVFQESVFQEDLKRLDRIDTSAACVPEDA